MHPENEKTQIRTAVLELSPNLNENPSSSWASAASKSISQTWNH